MNVIRKKAKVQKARAKAFPRVVDQQFQKVQELQSLLDNSEGDLLHWSL